MDSIYRGTRIYAMQHESEFHLLDDGAIGYISVPIRAHARVGVTMQEQLNSLVGQGASPKFSRRQCNCHYWPGLKSIIPPG